MYTELKETIESLNTSTIKTERQKVLQPLINFIQQKVDTNKPIRLNFICTHNSRRSHLGQIWTQAISNYFKIENVNSYSGGTQETALFPKINETLEKCGFKIETLALTSNPIYSIKYSENEQPVIGFSKVFESAFNPQSEFAAILTCSAADEGCPFIPGAEKRIPLTYNDPKEFDETPLQNEKYLERCLEIATELKYVFSEIN